MGITTNNVAAKILSDGKQLAKTASNYEQPPKVIYLEVDGQIQKMRISRETTDQEIQAAVASLYGIPPSEAANYSFSFHQKGGQNVNFLRENTTETAYITKANQISDSFIEELHELRKKFSSMDMDKLKVDGSCYILKDFPMHYENHFKVNPETDLLLRQASFNNWKFEDNELVHFIIHIYEQLGVMEHFKISHETLYSFVLQVRMNYNSNPFHNFKHAFCVFQMCYALMCKADIIFKFSPLERLSLLTACLAHDLDHPGYNNVYQINARTDLAIIYNDLSPLENHHCAVLFAILDLGPSIGCNIFSNLSREDVTTARKIIIKSIMATDMAKHGELVSAFSKIIPNFSWDHSHDRLQLMCILIKCADISTEVRPPAIADVWVNRLLEEFFCQSDREKEEGLPFLPFMDRMNVTKPGAQIGFLGFCVIPLYESLCKLFPAIEQDFMQPIRTSLAFYKELGQKQ